MTSPEALAAGWAAPLAAGSAGSASRASPGLLGFIVVGGMGLVLFFLLRSMNKHLRRVRSVREAGLEPGSEIDTAAAAGNGTARSAGQRIVRAPDGTLTVVAAADAADTDRSGSPDSGPGSAGSGGISVRGAERGGGAADRSSAG